MGFFSFKTQDTDRSISNIHSDCDTFRVAMIDNANNIWIERYYSGYGKFGGKDYYELVAQMNGKSTRDEGINICFDKDSNNNWLFPNLVENENNWEWKNEQPNCCPDQGYFY